KVALLYLIMTLTISQLVSYLERRFAKDDHGE
ncbi:MAG: nickel transporter, partial [Firmicutes bacterium]|nr:nickel transporter [Bacillota bacterium]